MVGELPTLFRVCMFVWEVEERKGGEEVRWWWDRKWVALEMLDLWEQSFDCDHLA